MHVLHVFTILYDASIRLLCCLLHWFHAFYITFRTPGCLPVARLLELFVTWLNHAAAVMVLERFCKGLQTCYNDYFNVVLQELLRAYKGFQLIFKRFNSVKWFLTFCPTICLFHTKRHRPLDWPDGAAKHFWNINFLKYWPRCRPIDIRDNLNVYTKIDTESQFPFENVQILRLESKP